VGKQVEKKGFPKNPKFRNPEAYGTIIEKYGLTECVLMMKFIKISNFQIEN
jgi:hypothetical protein